MNLGDILAIEFRNASIVVGFICIFVGLITRETHEANRGLGMALIVVGATMIVLAMIGRGLGWW
jgi:membrane-bound ClpP family serine protease